MFLVQSLNYYRRYPKDKTVYKVIVRSSPERILARVSYLIQIGRTTIVRTPLIFAKLIIEFSLGC